MTELQVIFAQRDAALCHRFAVQTMALGELREAIHWQKQGAYLSRLVLTELLLRWRK